LDVARALVSNASRPSQVCREHSLSESVVHAWKKEYLAKGEDAFRTDGAPVEEDDKKRIRALEESLGRAHLEVEFLRGILEKKGCLPGRSCR
jgi:transposase